MSDQPPNQEPNSNGGYANVDPAMLQQIQRAIAALQLSEQKQRAQQSENKQFHKFWQTQPVVHDEATEITEAGPIENKTLADVPQRPYPLPKGFEWDTVDLTNDDELDEVYTLLYNNYVEDDDCHFRFHYSKDFLKWALMPPGYKRDWHLVVRRTTVPERPIIGLITGIPCDLRVNNKTVTGVEINFLCVHKTLRSKRVAPMLIKEVTRRVNLYDIWNAAYTAGIVVPRPVSEGQYYHRSLNPKKLIDVGFSGKPQNKTMLQIKQQYQLPSAFTNKNLVPLTEEYVESAAELLNTQFEQQNTQLYQHFSKEDFAHFFLPRDGIIETFVIVDEETKKVTDFFSFYVLPSTIFGHPEHKVLTVAYSFYNCATTVDFVDLVGDALIRAKQCGADVYNMLQIMNHKVCWEPLKFTPGDGTLHYYVYNWKCEQFPSEQLGLVLF